MRPQDLGIGRLFDRVRDAVIVAEARSGRVILWNPAAEKVFGYSSSRALGMRVEELVPEHMKDQHRAGMARYGQSGRGAHIDSEALLELPAVREDGREIRVELSLNPLDSPDGTNDSENPSAPENSEDEERYVLAVVRDVSRRKEAEESLKESEERMRGLADAAFEGILITDGGEIMDANPAFFEMLGYKPIDVVGRSVLEFVAPEYRKLVQENILRGYEEPYEIAGVNAAGERVDLEVRGRPFSYRGRPVRVTTLQDIAERKKVQEAQAWLAAIVESSDDAIIGRTFDGTTTSWNSGAREMYGYTAEEVMGQPISMLIPPERPDEITDILERVRKGERVEHYETVRIRKDGTRLHASITVSPVRDASGKVIGASTIARDVSGRIEAEQEIRRLNQTLEKRVAERTERLAESERRLKELVGKVVAAQEDERRRVAYDIHDGLTQVAIAAHQNLQVFAQKHPPGTPVEEGSLDRALALAQRVVREARHVIEGLRPTSLDDFGLAVALCQEIEQLNEEGWEISCEKDLGGERLAPETETTLFRVGMEALTNVRKHAHTTRATVKLSRRSKKGPPGGNRRGPRVRFFGVFPERPGREGWSRRYAREGGASRRPATDKQPTRKRDHCSGGDPRERRGSSGGCRNRR